MRDGTLNRGMGRSNPSGGGGTSGIEAETALPVEGTLESAGERRPDSKAQIGTAETLPPPPMAEPALDRYVLVRELGRGGMGRVDEVYDSALGRAVARKASLVVASDVRAKMLIAEAQTCAQLEHPSIVPVYDAGTDVSGQPYYTMRNVRGRTLGQVLEDNKTGSGERKTLAQLLAIFRQVCLAVDYAHSRGVVHRDLKPDNVIVGEFGEVYILDWGIAHVMGGSDVRRAELEAFVAGSPGYIAPEQALGGEIDGRADIFALGAILHEILTGRVPFEDTDFRSVRLRASSRLTVAPSQRVPTVSPSFDSLVAFCLEPDPADRLASARLIADAIDVYLDGERERVERERDAERYSAEGIAARDAFLALDRESQRLGATARKELAAIPRWETASAKAAAWRRLGEARAMAAEAAHALARAEAAFGRALARVEGYPAARKGLALLYYRQFEEAETRRESERMVQYLDLARAYDDGDLRLELADSGELTVAVDRPDVAVSIARYEAQGGLSSLQAEQRLDVGANAPLLLAAGSYLVFVRRASHVVRYPVRIERAQRHCLSLAFHDLAAPDIVLIPGGPFRTADNATERLTDFGLARFPTTLRQYTAFLDAIEDPRERTRRMPRATTSETPGIVRTERGWELADGEIEGPALRRVRGREMDLPVADISFYDALAYVQWLRRSTGLPFRLPTDLEWEKAMRGADGRSFPMGNSIDPAFAKLRESRPEASQPEPVGAFPLDESPYGVRDLAGGVGDWTSTMVDGGEPPSLADEGTTADHREAVWRGGCWSMSFTLDPAMRYTQMLRHRVGWVGFRVALSLDGPSSDLIVEPMRRG